MITEGNNVNKMTPIAKDFWINKKINENIKIINNKKINEITIIKNYKKMNSNQMKHLNSNSGDKKFY